MAALLFPPRDLISVFIDYRAAVPSGQNAHDYNGSDDADTRDVALHYDRAGNLLWVNEGTLTGPPQFATGYVTVTGAGGTGYPVSNATLTLYLNVTGSQAWAANLNGSTSDYELWFALGHYLDGDRPAASGAYTNSMTGIRQLYNSRGGLVAAANGTYSVEVESEVFTQSGCGRCCNVPPSA